MPNSSQPNEEKGNEIKNENNLIIANVVNMGAGDNISSRKGITIF